MTISHPKTSCPLGGDLGVRCRQLLVEAALPLWITQGHCVGPLFTRGFTERVILLHVLLSAYILLKCVCCCARCACSAVIVPHHPGFPDASQACFLRRLNCCCCCCCQCCCCCMPSQCTLHPVTFDSYVGAHGVQWMAARLIHRTAQARWASPRFRIPTHCCEALEITPSSWLHDLSVPSSCRVCCAIVFSAPWGCHS